MIELISNSAHNSEIYIYLKEDPSGKRTALKVAMTDYGIAALRRECVGWSWYAQRRYTAAEAPAGHLLPKPGCLTWELDWIEGRTPRIDKGLWPVRIALHQAIDHYISIWPKEKASVPMHGDYSLLNMIFGPQGIHVLDWESFSPQGPPWGFDALHLLFEPLWYSFESHNGITSKEYGLIAHYLQILAAKGPLVYEFLNCPLENLQLWINRFPTISEFRPSKIPILQFPDKETKEIDRKIRQRMNDS